MKTKKKRMWSVKGICMIPMEAETIVEASSMGEAQRKAQAMFKANPQQLLITNSQDESAAWDWRSEAEEIK